MSDPPSLAPPVASSTSATDPSPPNPATEPPPPIYAPSQPQILVAPLPDSPSFFWGRTVQGEVFVKGLGAADGTSVPVSSLMAQLTLTNLYPSKPTLPISTFELQTLYPPQSSASTSSPSPFPSIHRFSIPLPQVAPLPGTLNLNYHNRGEVLWSLIITLTLRSGSVVTEHVPIEGTPQEIRHTVHNVLADEEEPKEEEEEVLEKDGVRCRMVLDSTRPRLGSLLRLGVEVHPAPMRKTAIADLSNQPNPSEVLRRLRRVRVEMFRRVRLPGPPAGSSSSARATTDDEGPQHLSLLYASGKSLRFPGTSSTLPPLRVLFTLPTTQLGSVADSTWGEITQSTPYHKVTFFIRTTIGFGGVDTSPGGDGAAWVLEREIEVRPKVWKEPRQVVVSGGNVPALGQGDENTGGMTETEIEQAYRLKGRDVVGETGTFRPEASSSHSDQPPPFDGAIAGPSGSHAEAGGLPTFLESEEQMRSGEAPLPSDTIPSQRLVPVEFETDEETRNVTVGRRGSLGGELGTWIEYDGYETFSEAPPDVAASYGAAGVMDPPQEGDEERDVVGGMMGRLGFEAGAGNQTGRELIESLGLGAGSRVVDLQDDLPPGIDEPSLPALPDFRPAYRAPIIPQPPVDQPPPSFAASEAAVAHRRASITTNNRSLPPPHGSSTPLPAAIVGHPPPTGEEGDAPPGYFGGGTAGAGPPAYS